MSRSPDQPFGRTAPAAPSAAPAGRPGWFRSLARHSTDRDAARRNEPGLLSRLLAEPTTRVLLADPHGRVSLAASASTPDLPDDGLAPAAPAAADRAVWQRACPGLAPLTVADLPATVLAALVRTAPGPDHPAGQAQAAGQASPPPADSPLAIYLGREDRPEGAASWIAVVVPAGSPTGGSPQGAVAGRWPSAGGHVPEAEGPTRPAPGFSDLLARYPLATLRAVGADLDAHDAGLAVPAVALAAWHARSRFCPACGGPLHVVQAGWARRCHACGALHFPRTDPAVIMAVTDEHDRLLLVHGAAWPERRYSVVAGFVEAGESAEQAVLREVAEETGLQVAGLEPCVTQPWPFPRSLMLAFRARLVPGQHQVVPDGKEVTAALLLSRAELVAALSARRIALPGATSIARALIEDWFGGPLPQ